MKSGLLLASIIAVASTGAMASSNIAPENRAKALEAIQVFQMSLKAELIGAIREGGPEAAISVCKIKAPEIADQTGQNQGLEIGRTSLKVRNPKNAPDAWEKATLENFEAMRAEGEPIASLEATTTENGTLRYMKAIPTQDVCTVCHGTNIDPDLYAKIKASYPDDQATGFTFGDIRGAFTVSMPISTEGEGGQ